MIVALIVLNLAGGWRIWRVGAGRRLCPGDARGRTQIAAARRPPGAAGASLGGAPCRRPRRWRTGWPGSMTPRPASRARPAARSSRRWLTEPIRALWQVNRALLGFLQTHRRASVATLDMDATLIETHKREALPCYKGFKAYQPLNCWWAEQGVVLHSEFRDGNVPAGYQQLRVLKDCLAAAAPA